MTGEFPPQEEDPEKKIERLQKELEETRRTSEERLTRLQYLQADFDNYRKGLEREKEQAVRLAGEALVRDLLPVLDDLDQALPALSQEKNREGLGLLARKLSQVLGSHGLESIESLGRRFDPALHEVLAKGAAGAEDGTILEVYQKGYRFRSKVLRPAKVKIAEQSGECMQEEEENHG